MQNVLLQTLCTQPSANIFLSKDTSLQIFIAIFINHVFHKKVPFCFHQSLFNLVNSIIYGGDQRIEKREIYKADRNPPIAASKRYLLTPQSSSFSFSETYNMIGGSEKRNPCLNLKCPVLEVLKTAIFNNNSPKWR